MGTRATPERSQTADGSAHPSGDDRFRYLDAAMKRHRYRPDALIEVLHTAQELFGYLEPDLLRYVARGLRLPPSRVFGVATFYHLFTFTPRGEHTCTVCTGTACYVKGADALLGVVEQITGTHPGMTTADSRISLETARCVGACGLAPIVVFDGKVVGQMTPEQLAERVKGWLDHGT
ncbi:bidirectional hydrogenase complex protein HoxE [Tautonia marina]|uniref:bidirectional hydrogenase complex protein HoxE n=1 Tax=Tautonia marina TaxID=2653855 RepID=UPI001260EA99|nr:bidirectional hydrogenase complex protein HoxE [Tautonia marina]